VDTIGPEQVELMTNLPNNSTLKKKLQPAEPVKVVTDANEANCENSIEI
jgi:hypothetical protein